jgi:prolyl oligopeptidase
MSEDAPIAYPPTLREHVVDTLFGETIADPYRWLENDVREDPRVRDWVEAQNRVTRATLDALPRRAAIAERLTRLWDYERYGLPERAGDRYFYLRNDGLQNQSTLHVQEGLEGPPKLLIDPNLWSEDGATALAEWKPSRDGRRLVYAVQEGGTDWRTLRVLDADSGETLADEVHWAKFTALAWARNGAGFFYSRFPEPEAGAAHQQLNLNHAIWFHSIGTPQASDRLVYATPDRPKLNHVAETTDDGRWLVVYSSEGTDERYEVTLIDLTSAKAERRTLVRGLEHNWRLAGADGTALYFLTNLEAPRQRVVKIDVSTPSRRMSEIVAEDEATLEGATVAGSRIVLSYLHDAQSEIRLVTLEGAPAGSVALPGVGAAQVQKGERGEPELFFRFASYATPASIYRLDADANEVAVFKAPQLAFDSSTYRVRQLFFTSKDGTRVPMFVVQRADAAMSGPKPAILYGYGGFNISLTPDFSPAILQWIEMGGVYAVANIRGGGEYGKTWHEGGRLANKQNSFDDFIAAAEHLIAEGITSKQQLAIRGGSNGGLLVGAVVNQRPDLFVAALPAVGVMDMLRFNRFTAGRYWIDDYGDPAKEEDFRLLRSYSPCHNILSGRDYPAILITTADTDDRVVPGHSFKYAAALQAARIGPRPHLIRIETRAGHGAGTPTSKMIEEYADLWAFAAKWTGLGPL